MPSELITRVFPAPPEVLGPENLVAAYTIPERTHLCVRVNMVSSLDGTATVDGSSRPLGGAADTRVLELLRRLADVVLVGAGTVRAEQYGAMILGTEAVKWRIGHGLVPQPSFALVSNRLDLDPGSDVFTRAPTRPIVFTTDAASSKRRHALEAVADVVSCGAESIDLAQMTNALGARKLSQILCEGGPSLFSSLTVADLVDELCLTISPLLTGGAGVRTARGNSPTAPRGMELVHVIESTGLLLTRYSRSR